MAIITDISSLVSQAHGRAWAVPAVAYLEGLLQDANAARNEVLALGVGQSFRRPLEHGLIAIEQAYVTAPRGPQKFETHVRNIDIQMIVSGREWMDVGPVGTFAVNVAYDKDKDVTFYHSRAPAAHVLAEPGVVAVFFQDDVHRGQISVEGPVLVHKVVIKVPVGV
jgi:YhcH/YjgK/YiaL family protein